MSRYIWFDFGKTVSKNTKTAVEVMQKTNLSWVVEPREIQVVGGSIIPNKVAITRKDTNVVLGVVNSTYKCVQNSQVFSFLDESIKQGLAYYYAAGHIGQGEKVWLLVSLHDEIQLSKNDTIQKLILFSNAHDGRGAIRAYFIPFRTRTQTLLNISFGKRVEQGIQMRHVGKVQQRITEAKKIFGLAENFYDVFESQIKKIYNANFDQQKIDLFLSNCFEKYSLDSTRTQNTLKKIKQLYEKEVKMFSNDSAWSWLNSVVNFIDHERMSKGKDAFDQISNHLESLFWGSGLLLKQRAWNAVSTLIKL